MSTAGALRAATVTLRAAKAAKTIPPSSVLPAAGETIAVFPVAQRRKLVVYARNGRADGDDVMRIAQRRGMQTVRTDSYRLNREENAVVLNVDRSADRILVRAPVETTVTVFPVAAARR